MTVVTNSGLITDLDLWMFGRRSVVLNYLVLEEDELCEQVVELTFGGTEMLTEKRNEFITEKLTWNGQHIIFKYFLFLQSLRIVSEKFVRTV